MLKIVTSSLQDAHASSGIISKAWLRDIRLSEVVVIATIYVVFARLGQTFAIEPSNVTPVWIPSGVLMAVALRYGPHIWPGVFLGAFLGNIWAYFSTKSFSTIFNAIASASMNGLGDVISIVVAAELIRHFARSEEILASQRTLAYYLFYGAILGPFASALFGSSGL
ncbi:hypothetical protein A3738_05470 [Oleiphilus sp. HI0066]|nr:hypothetical protein A3738_05470 [Oleiphilus sp. HI0066]